MIDIISAEEKRLDLINRTDRILEECLKNINSDIERSSTSNFNCYTGRFDTSREIMETVNDILIAMLTLKGYEVLKTEISHSYDKFSILINVEVP